MIASLRWLILNKLDLIPEEEREEKIAEFLKAYKEASGYDGPVFPITAITGDGTRPLIFALQEALEKLAPPDIELDDEAVEGSKGEEPEATEGE